MPKSVVAKRYWISGRVQGVGYRWFAEAAANKMGLRGWVRNLGDGRVEAYAIGDAATLSDFEGQLHKGPFRAEVRSLEAEPAAVDAKLERFSIR